jgi:hypothetical protein
MQAARSRWDMRANLSAQDAKRNVRKAVSRRFGRIGPAKDASYTTASWMAGFISVPPFVTASCRQHLR